MYVVLHTMCIKAEPAKAAPKEDTDALTARLQLSRIKRQRQQQTPLLLLLPLFPVFLPSATITRHCRSKVYIVEGSIYIPLKCVCEREREAARGAWSRREKEGRKSSGDGGGSSSSTMTSFSFQREGERRERRW